jgi:serine/threonine-protein kinase ATR
MAFNDDEPPPSTLAAHILRNGAAPPTQRDSVISANFTKLLEDFLREPVIEVGDSHLVDNHRFVCWLMDAAVEFRKASEPFTPNRNIEQAASCLRCIRHTLARHPEILQFNGSDCLKTSPEPPLSLKLTAKLLSIATREGLNAVWDGIVKVLSTCLSSQLSRPATWSAGVAYARFLSSALDGRFICC